MSKGWPFATKKIPPAETFPLDGSITAAKCVLTTAAAHIDGTVNLGMIRAGFRDPQGAPDRGEERRNVPVCTNPEKVIN
jgi:hypothetical protein